MARSKRILSPAVSDDDDSNDVPVPAKNKKTRSYPGSDDIESGSRVRKPSKAQQNIDKENLEKQAADILRLQKKLAKANKQIQLARDRTDSIDEEDFDRMPLESEEEDEDDTVGFSSSIVSRGVVETSDPPAKKGLHRETINFSKPRRIPRRSFLTDVENLAQIAAEALLPALSTPTQGVLPPSPPSPPPSSSPGPTSSSQPRDDIKPSDLRDNFVPGSRPKASDYVEHIEALLVRAMHEYACRIRTVEPFPDGELQTLWTRSTWDNACDIVGQKYELTGRMARLIKARGSHARSAVITAARALIPTVYGFSRSSGKMATLANHKIFSQLIDEGTFHHKDVAKQTGYGQNKIISEIIHLAWFDKKTSDGVVFKDYFNPISLQSIALIFTSVAFCLEEWKTGAFEQVTFTEKGEKIHYDSWMVNVQEWNALNPPVIKKMRVKLFVRALRSAKVLPSDEHISVFSKNSRDRAREELEGRTGDTDSEAEADRVMSDEDCM